MRTRAAGLLLGCLTALIGVEPTSSPASSPSTTDDDDTGGPIEAIIGVSVGVAVMGAVCWIARRRSPPRDHREDDDAAKGATGAAPATPVAVAIAEQATALARCRGAHALFVEDLAAAAESGRALYQQPAISRTAARVQLNEIAAAAQSGHALTLAIEPPPCTPRSAPRPAPRRERWLAETGAKSGAAPLGAPSPAASGPAGTKARGSARPSARESARAPPPRPFHLSGPTAVIATAADDMSVEC